MPAVSQAQRKYLYANKGAAWVKAHGFDNKGKLPDKIEPGQSKEANARAAARRVRTKKRHAAR